MIPTHKHHYMTALCSRNVLHLQFFAVCLTCIKHRKSRRLNWFFCWYKNLFIPAEPTQWLITAQRTPSGETLTLFAEFLYIFFRTCFLPRDNILSHHMVKLCYMLLDWWLALVGPCVCAGSELIVTYGCTAGTSVPPLLLPPLPHEQLTEYVQKTFRTPEDWLVIGFSYWDRGVVMAAEQK